MFFHMLFLYIFYYFTALLFHYLFHATVTQVTYITADLKIFQHMQMARQ